MQETLKVLSLIEPWATLIKKGKKVIETRSWKTSYRGDLYIHASCKKIKRSDAHTIELLKLIPNVDMEYGNIICKCKLVDCITKEYTLKDTLNEVKNYRPDYIMAEITTATCEYDYQTLNAIKIPCI